MNKLINLTMALALAALPMAVHAQAVTLDQQELGFETVHGFAQRAFLAQDAAGQALTAIVAIPAGSVLPPHGEAGGLRLLTVVKGTLSWGDGDAVDPAKERQFPPGSIIVVPATGGLHWAAARSGDVLFQVVFVRDGALAPEAAAQTQP